MEHGKGVCNLHLTRRNGTYYYRRRVPDFAVDAIGRSIIQYSLKTTDKREAKKLREFADLEWTARFERAREGGSHSENPDQADRRINVAALVRDYVERRDQAARKRLEQDPPISRQEVEELKVDAEMDLSSLGDPADPNRGQWISSAVSKILSEAKLPEATVDGDEIDHLVLRGLLELARRKRARLDDDYSRRSFDHIFDREVPSGVTFRELSEQYLRVMTEDAEINGISRKRTDKVKANVALLREIVGDMTPVSAIDHDACLRVRSVLAHTPTNRTKLYPKLNLDEAIARAELEKKRVLSATTQSQYLDTFKGVLELAFKKRLLTQNPAQSIRPLKRDDARPGEKRLPFTLEQIAAFFSSDFHRSCAPGAEKPYTRKDRDWRFWLPLVCLFMGMRPNEVCQMLVADVKRTKAGTWYVDVVASSDEDEDNGAAVQGVKTLKTVASRRRIPIHSELIALGFLELRAGKTSGADFFPVLSLTSTAIWRLTPCGGLGRRSCRRRWRCESGRPSTAFDIRFVTRFAGATRARRLCKRSADGIRGVSPVIIMVTNLIPTRRRKL